MEIEKVDKDKDKDKEEEMKKQVRRRVHSSKPYKERLMNMAEARREIATALKFHRASMKQQQQQQEAANANHHQLQTHPPSQQLSTNNYSIPHHYPISTIVPPPPPPLNQHEHLNLALPNQTLGLNLNFQDFNNLNTTVYYTPMSVATKEVAAIEIEPEKVIKPADSDHEDDDDDDDDGYHPFEQVMEFPPWLINANECSCLQEELSDEYSPDPALPWMDIGEIEGMDGEWLA